MTSMETVPIENTAPVRSVADELRARAMAWAIAGILPLPILVATDPATSGGIACIYLGFASGWLAMEFHRADESSPNVQTNDARSRRARALATIIAVALNVALFVFFGITGGVATNFPFPLMATLAAVPAIGLIPWLTRRVRQPYTALVLGAMIVLAAKLAACVVARFVYGPDYLSQGYIAGDWRTAKLMISLFWIFSTSLSLVLLAAELLQRNPIAETATVQP